MRFLTTIDTMECTIDTITSCILCVIVKTIVSIVVKNGMVFN